MSIALLYFSLVVSTVGGLLRSSIGVVSYYILALWSPMTAWPWVFSGVRASLIVAVTAVFGFAKDLVTGKLNFSVLKQRQNVYMAILWLCLILSYFLGGYPPNSQESTMENSAHLLTYYCKIFFFYFISVILIDNKKKYHAMIAVLSGVVLYYIYWANNEYLVVGLYKYRLAGPGPISGTQGGPYSDENSFAMLFVSGIPFLYFMGKYYKNKIIKYLFWIAIPFGWHAIFLTGSMGGFIGLAATTIFMAVRSRKKSILVALPILLTAAFIWQGGEYLKTKALDSSENVGGVSTAQTRFESWEAGAKMLMSHPLNGVGLGNFLTAYPDVSKTRPFVAHNTLLQFAAESGVIAGLMYILLFLNIVVTYMRQRHLDEREADPLLLAARESVAASMLGFYVCSMFLNLGLYEAFYYLLILNSVQQRLIAAIPTVQTTDGSVTR